MGNQPSYNSGNNASQQTPVPAFNMKMTNTAPVGTGCCGMSDQKMNGGMYNNLSTPSTEPVYPIITPTPSPPVPQPHPIKGFLIFISSQCKDDFDPKEVQSLLKRIGRCMKKDQRKYISHVKKHPISEVQDRKSFDKWIKDLNVDPPADPPGPQPIPGPRPILRSGGTLGYQEDKESMPAPYPPIPTPYPYPQPIPGPRPILRGTTPVLMSDPPAATGLQATSGPSFFPISAGTKEQLLADYNRFNGAIAKVAATNPQAGTNAWNVVQSGNALIVKWRDQIDAVRAGAPNWQNIAQAFYADGNSNATWTPLSKGLAFEIINQYR